MVLEFEDTLKDDRVDIYNFDKSLSDHESIKSIEVRVKWKMEPMTSRSAVKFCNLMMTSFKAEVIIENEETEEGREAGQDRLLGDSELFRQDRRDEDHQAERHGPACGRWAHVQLHLPGVRQALHHLDLTDGEEDQAED